MSTSKDGYVKVLSKENSSGFQSWDLPNVNFNEKNDTLENESLPMLTADELEKIHQQAYTEGYEEGKLKGLKEGFEQGETEGKTQGHQQAYDESLKNIEEKIIHFEKLFLALEKPLTQTNEQVEYELMQLSISIAKHIVKQEIKTAPEHIIQLVKSSLDLLPSAAKNVTIYLNPLDIAMVKEAFNLIENKNTNDANTYNENRFEKLRVLDNSKITQGGCIVDTNISHIDASIEQRIDELAEKLIPPAPSFERDPALPEIKNTNEEVGKAGSVDDSKLVDGSK
ncbi:MAG: flagellar assembly protein FliH, partial [Pseudomonadota bacterium]